MVMARVSIRVFSRTLGFGRVMVIVTRFQIRVRLKLTLG